VRGVFRTDHTAWEIGTVTEHRVWPDAGHAHSRSPRRWPSCFGWMNWPASRGPFLPGPPAGCPPWRMLLRSHWGSSLSPDQPTTHFAAGKTQTALVVVMEPSVAWMIACVNMLMYKIISFSFCCRKLLFSSSLSWPLQRLVGIRARRRESLM
jgi:hypothetical protein